MDVMTEVISYLAANTNVRVASEVPANRPTQLYTVAQVGGPTTAHLGTPRVDIDAWAQTDAQAHALLVSASDAMMELPDSSALISDIERTAFYRSDVDGWHRWTATFAMTRNV